MSCLPAPETYWAPTPAPHSTNKSGYVPAADGCNCELGYKVLQECSSSALYSVYCNIPIAFKIQFYDTHNRCLQQCWHIKPQGRGGMSFVWFMEMQPQALLKQIKENAWLVNVNSFILSINMYDKQQQPKRVKKEEKKIQFFY